MRFCGWGCVGVWVWVWVWGFLFFGGVWGVCVCVRSGYGWGGRGVFEG